MKQWFSSYRYWNPGAYEAWFEGLAAQGYYPRKISHFSQFCMKFEKGEPKRYKYVVDLQARPKKEYFATYESFGWEYVGRMSNLFVWRKEYGDEKPQAFSDAESVRKRNARVAQAISFSVVASGLASILLLVGMGVSLAQKAASTAIVCGVLGGVFLLASAALAALALSVRKKGAEARSGSGN